MSRTVRIEQMRPLELQETIDSFPVVYLPFGLIEWHGPHNPLGTDSVAVEAIANGAARGTGGAVFPTFFLHVHHVSLGGVLPEIFLRLKHTGFKLVALMSWHGAPAIFDLARRAAEFVEDDSFKVLPFAPGGPGDHGGINETSLMLHLRPDDVDVSTLDGIEPVYNMKSPLGIGSDGPPQEATKEWGEEILRISVDNTVAKVRDALSGMAADPGRKADISCGRWWMI